MSEQERRDFFRIDDEIALNYRVATEDELNNNTGLRVNEADSLSLATELEKMKAASRIHFRHVEKEIPEVARYFTHLEKKIDLIARHVMMGADGLFTKNTQSVSISASGLAFTTDEALQVDSMLELKFILNPSLTCIHSYSKVVACAPQDDGKYKIAVEFSWLDEDDREILIRHVVQKQMNDIRDHK